MKVFTNSILLEVIFKKGRRAMKKVKFISGILLSIMIAFCLTACGDSSDKAEGENQLIQNDTKKTTEQNASAESKQTSKDELDLTGNWVQKDGEGTSSYQAGFIKDGVIELFWMSDNGNSASLYWAGSCEEPQNPSDKFKWNSTADKIKTQYAILASNEDTKVFTYNKGEIIYEVSALGVTKTVTLVPTDTDYSKFEETGGGSGTAQDGKVIELVNARYWIIPGSYGNGNTLYYAEQIHNPNEKYVVNFPKIHITAKSADGSILKTEDQVLNSIAANDTITYGSSIYYEGAIADTVELYVDNGANDYAHQDGAKVIRQSDLVISNTSENPGTIGTTYTGMVANNSTVDLDTVCINVVYIKDGQMFGGETTYIDDLKSGASKPFEISQMKDIDHDSYEIYALQW